MLIAHVHFTVAPGDRVKAINALLAEAPTVRAMKGCRTFIPFTDPTDAAAIGILHEWENSEDFAAYVASPGFAEFGQDSASADDRHSGQPTLRRDTAPDGKLTEWSRKPIAFTGTLTPPVHPRFGWTGTTCSMH